MKLGLVSVVIPVYNVEDYLKECLDSVINQSYRYLQIILINDGSTDTSRFICDEYRKKDDRVKVIHKENGGLSEARNVGLENSIGEYVVFVDSDDYIHKDFIRILLENLIYNNADISLSDFSSYKLSNEVVLGKAKKMSFEDFFTQIKSLTTKIIVCNKLYKIDIWNGVRFEKNKLHEDVFVFLNTCYNRKFVYDIQKLYFYRERLGSITKTPSEKSFIDSIEGFSILLDFFNKNDKKYCKIILEEIIYLNVRYFNAFKRNKPKIFLKKNFVNFLLSKRYNIKEKTHLLIRFLK